MHCIILFLNYNQMGNAGVKVEAGDNKVEVKPTGIHITDGKDKIDVGFDGIKINDKAIDMTHKSIIAFNQNVMACYNNECVIFDCEDKAKFDKQGNLYCGNKLFYKYENGKLNDIKK